MTGKIAEVFDSVQGEGLYLGEKQLFVRFFGCNLNCSYCDTKLDHFKEYRPQELFEELKLYRDEYHSVSFTGGEPLLQNDFLREVLYATCCYGFRNYLETNGTLVQELESVINYLDIVAMDLKLPSSTGQAENCWKEHRDFLKVASRKQVFLKSVICGSTTEDDLRESLELIMDCDRAAVLVLQPNSREDYQALRDKLKKFKKHCKKAGVTSCIIPQMQKIMGIK